MGTYYKVVKKYNGGIFVSFLTTAHYSLNYCLNARTEAPEDTVGIFAFEDLDTAVEYGIDLGFQCREDWAVLKGRGKKKKRIPETIATNPYTKKSMDRFYKNPEGALGTWVMPRGKIVLESFTPTKVMYDSENKK